MSIETTIKLRELRRLKRDLRIHRKIGDEKTFALAAAQACVNAQAARITMLAAEVDEWKRRFDALLARTPEVKA